MVLSGTCTFMGSELAPRVPLSSDLERDPMDYVGKVFSLLSDQPQGKVKVKSLSHVPLFVTPGTVAHQAPQSMEFSRQESWSGLPRGPTSNYARNL